jgi:hypothetical protein
VKRVDFIVYMTLAAHGSIMRKETAERKIQIKRDNDKRREEKERKDKTTAATITITI